MTKSWRPEGWEDHTGEGWDTFYGAAFEDGADAMLEALRCRGDMVEVIDQWGNEPPWKHRITIISIPADEQ